MSRHRLQPHSHAQRAEPRHPRGGRTRSAPVLAPRRDQVLARSQVLPLLNVRSNLYSRVRQTTASLSERVRKSAGRLRAGDAKLRVLLAREDVLRKTAPAERLGQPVHGAGQPHELWYGDCGASSGAAQAHPAVEDDAAPEVQTRKEPEELYAHARRPGQVRLCLSLQSASGVPRVDSQRTQFTRHGPTATWPAPSQDQRHRRYLRLRTALSGSLPELRRAQFRRHLADALERTVCCQHPHHCHDLPHRHPTVQVPRTTDRLSVCVLLCCRPSLPGSKRRWLRRDSLRRSSVTVRGPGPGALCDSLPHDLLLRHGVVGLVGDPRLHLVFSSWTQVGQRGHRQLLAVLPPGGLAGANCPNSLGPPAWRNRRGSCRGSVHSRS